MTAVPESVADAIGADPESSEDAAADRSAYFVESIGHFVHPQTDEDTWPRSYDRGVADRFERAPDRESLLTARRLARDEGLLTRADLDAATT